MKKKMEKWCDAVVVKCKNIIQEVREDAAEELAKRDKEIKLLQEKLKVMKEAQVSR